MFLAPLEDVKLILGVTNTAQDQLIEELLESLSKAADSYCGRVFEEQEFIEYHDGGVQRIFLKNPPITEVINVWVDTEWEWDADTIVDPSEFRLTDPNTGIVTYKDGYWTSFPEDKDAIKVHYLGGYNPVSIPADLSRAIAKQTAYEVRRRQDLGLIAVSHPDGTIQKRFIDEWLPEVKGVLDRYFLLRM